MPSPERPLWEPDLAAFSMGNEIRACLRDLIAAARLDWTPSGFTEKHLVDELAINKWRQLRVLSMQNAIYRHEQAAGMANNPKVQGQPSQPPEPGGDMYFYAMCHAPERHGDGRRGRRSRRRGQEARGLRLGFRQAARQRGAEGFRVGCPQEVS